VLKNFLYPAYDELGWPGNKKSVTYTMVVKWR